jgi:hypothetical protein
MLFACNHWCEFFMGLNGKKAVPVYEILGSNGSEDVDCSLSF